MMGEKTSRWSESERAEIAEQRERDNAGAYERDENGVVITVLDPPPWVRPILTTVWAVTPDRHDEIVMRMRAHRWLTRPTS